MTKREIVDRLLSIYVQDNYAIPGAVRELLLNLAAPETEEEKHPGVAVPVNEKYPATCLKCGGEVQMLHEDGVYYCPKCNAAFCAPKGEPKRGEGEPKRREGEK